MKRFLYFLLPLALLGCQQADESLLLGDEQFDAYLPLLQNQRVAIYSNQSGLVGGERPLLDVLLEKEVNVTAIFSPEHGYKGIEDDATGVDDAIEPATGLPILSLWGDEGDLKPTEHAMTLFDVLVVDIQDVGLRYYTYYITLCHLMDACGAHDKAVILLDRPNPHGDEVDGPILEEALKSEVGYLPLPILHGLTLGELAGMAIGEKWLKEGNDCRLTVIPCKHYTHGTRYILPVAPSPNLPNETSIDLYPSICPFEGTVMSLGRGTDKPFQQYGHPLLKVKYSYSFTPQSVLGATQPPLLGEECFGVDLSMLSHEEIRQKGMDFSYLMDAYSVFKEEGKADAFFTPFFDLLMGCTYVREMILEGHSIEEIRARWADELQAYKVLRQKYLLYDE